MKRAKNIHVKIPPPTCRAKYAGTKVTKVMRAMLEKLSLPAASAGSGAFLMEGYYHVLKSAYIGIQETGKPQKASMTYGRRPHTIIF